MECELRLPAVDVVLSSKRTLTDGDSSPTDNQSILGGLSFSLYMKDFKLNVYHPFSGEPKVHVFEDAQSGQLQTRSSLAVSVQSVSINISRIRSLIDDKDGEPLNSIDLSAIVQISKGRFEYDIRRFPEILTFPKIWYNSGLARRLFLGDQTLPTKIRSSPVVTRRTTTNKQKSSRKQARILLAVQLKELHVSMRMSNVMGIVEWNNQGMNLTGSIKLNSLGKRTYHFALSLMSSIFEAEQGIVGGLIRLKNIRAAGSCSSVNKKTSES